MTAEERKPQVRGEAVREKILATADDLFYRQGVRAVGIDTIIEKAGVAKTSLYRWFPTKDALVAAYLQRHDDQYWAQWDKISQRHAGAPRRQLEAQLAWIAKYVASAGYRGCPFISTATEFPDLEHPGRAVCQANKSVLRDRLLELTTAAKADEPELLANQLALLIDGAYANAQVMGRAGAARALEAVGRAVLEASLRSADA